MRRPGGSEGPWHFWDTGHQGNGTCSGLSVPGDQTPTDGGAAGGAGDLWALGGYWAGSRGAVTPTLLPWGSVRWGAWPLPHTLGVPEPTRGTGGPQLLPSCLGVPSLGRGDSSVPLSCAMGLHGSQLVPGHV